MNKPHRINWLGMLAKLVTPNDPAKAFGAMEAYLPFLATLPDEAFTPASVEHVAMSPRRLHIPDLSEVKAPLQAWWRENGPRRTAIAAPAKAAEPEYRASPEERAAVAEQLRALVADMAPSEPERPKVRAHIIPAEVLAEARAKLMAGRR